MNRTIADEVIRAAMQSMVDEVGGDHKGMSMYGFNGRGECFLGALCQRMMGRIPEEATLPKDVLGRGRLSQKMAFAFQIAQNLNDRRFEWKYVLAGVDLALAMDLPEATCNCGCGVAQGANDILEEVRKMCALDHAKMAMNRPVGGTVTWASGGSITSSGVSITPSGVIPTSASWTWVNFPEVTVTSTFSPTLYQKDHALIA